MIKQIPYHDGYSVDEEGNVYSKTGRLLKCSINSIGYKQLYTYRDGKFEKVYLVHRLVFETFNQKIDDDKVIDHINRDHTDNRLCNLRMVTQKENIYNSSRKFKKNLA